jgi:hypothetical protein
LRIRIETEIQLEDKKIVVKENQWKKNLNEEKKTELLENPI